MFASYETGFIRLTQAGLTRTILQRKTVVFFYKILGATKSACFADMTIGKRKFPMLWASVTLQQLFSVKSGLSPSTAGPRLWLDVRCNVMFAF